MGSSVDSKDGGRHRVEKVLNLSSTRQLTAVLCQESYQAAREFRLHRNAMFRDFATGHGDDLEGCSGTNCSKYLTVRPTDRESQSEQRSLLICGKKPESPAVVD